MLTVEAPPNYSVYNYKPLIERLSITLEFPQFLCEATAIDLLVSAPKKYTFDAYNLLDGKKKYKRVGVEAETNPESFIRAFQDMTQDTRDIKFSIDVEVPPGGDIVLLDKETGLVTTSVDPETFTVEIVLENGWDYVWEGFVDDFLLKMPQRIRDKVGDDEVTVKFVKASGKVAVDNVKMNAPQIAAWLLVQDPQDWLTEAYTVMEHVIHEKATGPSSLGQKIFRSGFMKAFQICKVKASCQCSWFDTIQREGSSKEWALNTNRTKWYETAVYSRMTDAELDLLDNPKIKQAVLKGEPLWSNQPDQLASDSAINTKAAYTTGHTKDGEEVQVVNAGKVLTDSELKELRAVADRVKDDEMEIMSKKEIQNLMRYPCLHILRVLAGGQATHNPDGTYKLCDALAQSVTSAVWANKNTAKNDAVSKNYEQYAKQRFDAIKARAEKRIDLVVTEDGKFTDYFQQEGDWKFGHNEKVISRLKAHLAPDEEGEPKPAVTTSKKGRGRPKGAKNKPKDPNAPQKPKKIRV